MAALRALRFFVWCGVVVLAAAQVQEPQILTAGGNVTLVVDGNSTIGFQIGQNGFLVTDLASTASMLALVNSLNVTFTNALNAAVARITTLEQNAVAATTLAMGTQITAFHSSFSRTTLPTGWTYLWNTGSIGNQSQYTPLTFNSASSLWAPGPGVYWGFGNGVAYAGPTRTQAASGGLTRYAIAGITISKPGLYFLSNTSITPGIATCATGSMVRVYVNNVLVKLVTAAALVNSTFDSVLGSLNVGDNVYVAVGAAADNTCTPQFTMDYTLQMFASNSLGAAMAAANMVPANKIVATDMRACEPTDVGVVYSYQGTLQLCTSVGWSGYFTAATVNNTLTNYATLTNVASTLTAYPTLQNLNSTLTNYATLTNVASTLTAYPTLQTLNSTLTNYPTNANLANTLLSYTTLSYHNTTLASALSLYTPTTVLAATYLTQSGFSSAIAAYSTSASIASTYATSAAVASTYVTQASLTTTLSSYSTSANIAATYVTQSALATTLASYSTSASIASTYVTQTALATTLSAYSNSASIAATYVPITNFTSATTTLSQGLTSVTSQSAQTTSTLTAMRGTTVAWYRGDFQYPPKVGWSYLWNGKGSPVGVSKNYVPLIFAPGLNLDGYNGYNGLGVTTLPASNAAQWLTLSWLGGHAGNGVDDGSCSPYPCWSRYAIAGYTVNQTAVYAIVNTTFTGTLTSCGLYNQIRLKIFINDTYFRDYIIFRQEVNSNFDTRLGLLSANTTIYLTVGSGDDGVACDHFAWDFSIVMLPNDYFGLSFGAISFNRVYPGLLTTFAGYRRAFHSPSYLREGWAYLWNANGPIGNNSNYVQLIWDGVTEYSGTGSSTFPNSGNSAYCQLGWLGGHPGPAVAQGQVNDRYAIAAYTMQYSGNFQIANSNITRSPGSCGTGDTLVVYVNNGVAFGPTVFTGSSSISFNVNLGYLFGGDIVYVMIGPNGADSCDFFYLDFEIREFYFVNGLNEAIAGGDYGTTPGSETI